MAIQIYSHQKPSEFIVAIAIARGPQWVTGYREDGSKFDIPREHIRIIDYTGDDVPPSMENGAGREHNAPRRSATRAGRRCDARQP